MMPTDVVIDTNVLVAALQSKQGASYRLFQELEKGRFVAVLSVPLFLEYEEVLSRFVGEGRISKRSSEKILDYLSVHSRHVEVHYLWRPFLNDPDDAMVLEAALAGGVKEIVTYNKRDFVRAEPLGVFARSPVEMLKKWGVIQ